MFLRRLRDRVRAERERKREGEDRGGGAQLNKHERRERGGQKIKVEEPAMEMS